MKWEYLSITIEAKGIYSKNLNEDKTVGKLNELGEDGWELVSVVPISRTGIWTSREATYAFAFVLKRPVK